MSDVSAGIGEQAISNQAAFAAVKAGNSYGIMPQWQVAGDAAQATIGAMPTKKPRITK
jgi:hypothetical protein